MEDLLNFIFKNHIPVIIVIVIAVFVFIIEVYKNANVIKEICVRFFGWLKNKVFRAISNHKRRKYNKCVSTIEFLKWQQQILEKIYDKAIVDFNNEEKTKENPVICEYVNLFNNKFEAVYFKAPNEIHPPFKGLFDKTKVKYREFDKDELKRIKKDASREQKKYYKLLKPKIHYPYNVGYMLDYFDFHSGNNKDDFYFEAKTGVYLENVYTSNVLEYELYKLYKKKKNDALKMSSEDILKNLPQRKHIHEEIKKENKNILTSGIGRHSLLSVSMMVLCKNKNGKYDALRIRRSENVDAKVGFLQFVPSGGFSALDAGLDFDSQFANASLTKGLLREFLEECFGQEDYSGIINHSPEDVYTNSVIKDLDLSCIQFLGTALSLVSLRHELCFLMVIDDEKIISKMKANDESDNTLHYIDVEKLEDENFWNRYCGDNRDILMLNATSAALLNLAQKSSKYTKILNPNKEQSNNKENAK